MTSHSVPSPPIHTPAFLARRVQNWVMLGLMYGFFYMSRYNFSSAQAAIADRFGWSHTDYGLVLTAALLTYACAVFMNGPLVDRLGGKWAILLGAAGAAFFNLLFGLCHLFLQRPAVLADGRVIAQAELRFGMTTSTLIATLAVLWGFNHYFQSLGALAVVKINAAWFHVGERGRFTGIFGILIMAGRLLAFSISPLILLVLPWQFVFWIPAALLILMLGLCSLRLADSPAHAGLPALDTGDETDEESRTRATLGFILRKVLARPAPWIVAFSSMCIGVVRNSIDHWYARYIGVMFHIPARELSLYAPYQVSAIAMPLAAVLGGLAAGHASDRIFGARRAPVICIAFLGQACCLIALYLGIRMPWVSCALLVLISFCIQSAHSIIGGAASMDLGGQRAVATAAGLFDGAQYLAGSLVGAGMGRVLDRYRSVGAPGAEFAIWPLVPLPFALGGALLIALLWNMRPGRRLH